jgi:hypothetical protein
VGEGGSFSDCETQHELMWREASRSLLRSDWEFQMLEACGISDSLD